MEDIKFGDRDTFSVIGFFTPNYETYARAFSTNLQEHDVPHHLYSISARKWREAILYKPFCIGRAREDYPRSSLVSMDVDCRVRGSIKEGLTFSSDVGLRFVGRVRTKNPTVYPTTRVTVWNPTDGAERLRRKWASLCKEDTSLRNDELLLMQAIFDSVGMSITCIPASHVGVEIAGKWSSPSHVIVHDSVHDRGRIWQPIKAAARDLRHKAFEAITGKSYVGWKYGKF